MIKFYLLILFVISSINACTTIDPDNRENTSQTNNKSSDQQARVITTVALAQQRSNLPAKKKSEQPSRQAVLNLLVQSEAAIKDNNYPEAESLLKRALRIEPGNAWLWHNMAVLKFYQHDYQQAIQQALKSNNLEKNNVRLRLDNEKIIKQSHIELDNFK